VGQTRVDIGADLAQIAHVPPNGGPSNWAAAGRLLGSCGLEGVLRMVKLLCVGLGGFVGAVARYGLSGLVHRGVNTAFPLGTLVVNVAGCLAIGGFMYLIEDRALVSSQWRVLGAIGLLGAFTTFSTFGYETLALLRDRELTMAGLSVAGNVLLGLGAVWLGRTTLRALGV